MFQLYAPDYDYLAHHGIKGQRWGVRRFQNPDGTLTTAGEKRYVSREDKWRERKAKKLTRRYERGEAKRKKADEREEARLEKKYLKALDRSDKYWEKADTNLSERNLRKAFKSSDRQNKAFDKWMKAEKQNESQRKIREELHKREMENLSKITPGQYRKTAVGRFIKAFAMSETTEAGWMIARDMGYFDRPTEVTREERKQIERKYS